MLFPLLNASGESDYFHTSTENFTSLVRALSLSEQPGPSTLFFSRRSNTLAISAPVGAGSVSELMNY